jgi:hypothetical protein
MFLSLNSQHIIHLPNITQPKSIKQNLQPHFIINHHGFTIYKHLYQWPQQTSKWWTIGTPPPRMNHDRYKHTTLGQPKFQHHTHPYYNTATTTTLYLGHPAVKRLFCQRYTLLLKAPKARATCRQSMDHTCNMIQIIKTMKLIFWSVNQNGDVRVIAIRAFADMDRLPDFDEMVAHPALLIPQKIPLDEDAILPYFPNLAEAIPIESNAMSFFMAHNILFHELQDRVALHIWPHSIKISPDQSDPYDIPNDTFCNL